VARKEIVIRLAPDDISAVRFGVSPGHELAHAIRTLLRPHDHPLAWGWLRAVSDRVPERDASLLRLVIGRDGYLPDVLTSSPAWDLTPDEEFLRIRAAAPDAVRVDLRKRAVRSSGAEQDALLRLADDPLRARAMIADAAAAFWAAALDPFWTRMVRLLHADIGSRSRRLAREGLAGVFGELNEAVTWDGDRVRLRTWFHAEEVDGAGRGLVLVPSIFGRRCAAVTQPPAQPALFYPALGVSEVWHRGGEERAESLAGLLGPGRARVFLAVAEPCSTTEAADLARVSLATASHHLAALREAGLIVSRRDGRRMMHVRTPLGDGLAAG